MRPSRVVIAGAGFGGVYALRYLHRHLHGSSEVQLRLINRSNYFLFTPLLHEVATGGIAMPLVIEPLRGVVDCCLDQLHVAEIEQVNLTEQTVVTSFGSVDYDYLVLATGATTNFFNAEGAQQHSLTLKSLDDARRMKSHLLRKFECASQEKDPVKRKQMLRFVVIGGGPTGVELAAEIADLFYGTIKKLYQDSPLLSDVSIVLIEPRDILLAQLDERMGKRSAEVLRDKNIDVRFGLAVEKVTPASVVLSTGEKLATETAIWVAGVRPADLDIVGEVKRDEGGRLLVRDTLQLLKHPEVFVLGDMAHVAVEGFARGVPATAQAATRQAKAVADNVLALLNDQKPAPFEYEHAGYLVSLGRWMAVAHVKGFYFSGRFAWWFWRTVYLFKMLSWRKRLKVAIDWTWDLFAPRDISQV